MNLREILLEAMKLEQDGYNFYMQMAETHRNQGPDVVTLFKQLAHDEQLHHEYIRLELEAQKANSKKSQPDIPSFGWSDDPEGENRSFSVSDAELEAPTPGSKKSQHSATSFGWSDDPEGENRSFSVSDANEPGVLDSLSLVFPSGIQALKALPANPTEADGLLYAMGIEQQSFTLYANSARQSPTESARQLFLSLAQAEHKHFELLMQRYESRYSYPR